MSEEDNRSSMIMSMESKLNSNWFTKRQDAHKNYCTLSTGQYWDWLTYIDVSFNLGLPWQESQSCFGVVVDNDNGDFTSLIG